MPITSVTKDPEALTMTVVAEFPVPVERLWDAYTDPRQIERFWGPVEWPATFTRHDCAVGGRTDYYMTGPDGERSGGYWTWLAVDPGRSFEVEDGFATEDAQSNPDLPSMRMTFTFEPTPAGSRLSTTTHFPSLEALEQLLGMGMEEGMRSAMSQIDAVVADLESFAAGRGTESQILSDTQVRISRAIRGSAAQVWRAHHEPELMRRWLLGPEGWTMPVCVVARNVGDSYRNEWAPVAGGAADGQPGFGFEGELLASEPPYREVTTERMIGMPGEGNVNELTLIPRSDGTTLLSLLITYPNAEMRDMILATGMTDGMETSYARLESEILSPA
ncbi:SRPBCC family protein [Demequina lignilytica]|uniref:SRPBCC family protein n=1 Tax=Demequina lignilytica TaxID=3051663 RepID=A0AB35MKC1_9MICO|nr:SRPBCC family protein [Demequina sp. SYSU T0a273]MDN4484271.1 SRPBCC family protein [Demequina sp. SYSU T0a273]